MAQGKALFPATVARQGKTLLDTEHKAAKAWRKEYRIKAPKSVAKVIDTPEPRNMGLTDIEEEIRAYWTWTLEDIVRKCGTMPVFATLLQAADKIEAIHLRRLQADKQTGELISREYVSRNVMSLIERIFQRLLTETPVSLAFEVHGKCETGATTEQIQQAIHDALSRELRTIKADTKKAIRDATD